MYFITVRREIKKKTNAIWKTLAAPVFQHNSETCVKKGGFHGRSRFCLNGVLIGTIHIQCDKTRKELYNDG